ncbi:hypothetical protein OIO90_002169 [Microbotryomycetes sp. JL221]|nr:hypothetical protein OIO90_002169 [Microbotryomycetes sp. JL221]
MLVQLQGHLDLAAAAKAGVPRELIDHVAEHGIPRSWDLDKKRDNPTPILSQTDTRRAHNKQDREKALAQTLGPPASPPAGADSFLVARKLSNLPGRRPRFSAAIDSSAWITPPKTSFVYKKEHWSQSNDDNEDGDATGLSPSPHIRKRTTSIISETRTTKGTEQDSESSEAIDPAMTTVTASVTMTAASPFAKHQDGHVSMTLDPSLPSSLSTTVPTVSASPFGSHLYMSPSRFARARPESPMDAVWESMDKMLSSVSNSVCSPSRESAMITAIMDDGLDTLDGEPIDLPAVEALFDEHEERCRSLSQERQTESTEASESVSAPEHGDVVDAVKASVSASPDETLHGDLGCTSVEMEQSDGETAMDPLEASEAIPVTELEAKTAKLDTGMAEPDRVEAEANRDEELKTDQSTEEAGQALSALTTFESLTADLASRSSPDPGRRQESTPPPASSSNPASSMFALFDRDESPEDLMTDFTRELVSFVEEDVAGNGIETIDLRLGKFRDIKVPLDNLVEITGPRTSEESRVDGDKVQLGLQDNSEETTHLATLTSERYKRDLETTETNRRPEQETLPQSESLQTSVSLQEVHEQPPPQKDGDDAGDKDVDVDDITCAPAIESAYAPARMDAPSPPEESTIKEEVVAISATRTEMSVNASSSLTRPSTSLQESSSHPTRVPSTSRTGAEISVQSPRQLESDPTLRQTTPTASASTARGVTKSSQSPLSKAKVAKTRVSISVEIRVSSLAGSPKRRRTRKASSDDRRHSPQRSHPRDPDSDAVPLPALARSSQRIDLAPITGSVDTPPETSLGSIVRTTTAQKDDKPSSGTISPQSRAEVTTEANVTGSTDNVDDSSPLGPLQRRRTASGDGVMYVRHSNSQARVMDSDDEDEVEHNSQAQHVTSASTNSWTLRKRTLSVEPKTEMDLTCQPVSVDEPPSSLADAWQPRKRMRRRSARVAEAIDKDNDSHDAVKNRRKGYVSVSSSPIKSMSSSPRQADLQRLVAVRRARQQAFDRHDDETFGGDHQRRQREESTTIVGRPKRTRRTTDNWWDVNRALETIELQKQSWRRERRDNVLVDEMAKGSTGVTRLTAGRSRDDVVRAFGRKRGVSTRGREVRSSSPDPLA